MLSAIILTPFFVAVLICWIFSVCVHEFCHAVVAYWGGDRSVRDRGYLRFDPLSYVHPVTSILLPLLFLGLGGLPLPGGAVRIEVSALRSGVWASLVAAAGPASNFLLFLAITAVIHLGTGLVESDPATYPNWARLLGALAVLQLMAVFFNLLPVPPLDGYAILEPFLNDTTRRQIAQSGWLGLVVLYVVFFHTDVAMKTLMDLVDTVLQTFGLPWELTWRQYNVALFGRSA